MASNQDFVDFVLEQIESAGLITYKKMFGEYGIYSDGKMFALVCDNKLFFKITEGGKAFIKNPVLGSPYKGAKPIFLIEEQIENRDWLSELTRITVKELPEPKPKKKKLKK